MFRWFLDGGGRPAYYYAPDDGAGGGNPGSSTSGDDKTDKPKDKPNAGGNDGGSSTETTPVLTQEQVNALVGQARTQGREKALSEYASEHGFTDVNALAQALKDFTAAQEAQKTEAQKKDDQLAKMSDEIKDLKAQVVQANERLIAERRDNAIRAAASKAGAVDSSDVILWAGANVKDKLEACADKDGNVVEAGIAALIDHVKKQRPAWFAPQKTTPQTPGSPSNSTDGGAPGDAAAALAKARREAMSRARG